MWNNKQLSIFNGVKNSVRLSIKQSIETGKTQIEALQDMYSWINNYKESKPNHIPKSAVQSLSDYARGYFEAATEDKTVFLYKVEGIFYAAHQSDADSLGLQHWSELGVHKDLTRKGGIFWRHNMKPFCERAKRLG